jgi:hypothetical protein
VSVIKKYFLHVHYNSLNSLFKEVCNITEILRTSIVIKKVVKIESGLINNGSEIKLLLYTSLTINLYKNHC